jgi:hypothetical protein
MPLILSVVAFLALSANAQEVSVATARAVSGDKPAAEINDVAIMDGVRELRGTLFVTADSIRFCCRSVREAEDKAAAKCPYSFTIAAKEVRTQLLTTGDQKWHVMTSSESDYEFKGDTGALSRGFEAVKKSYPAVMSKTVEKLSGSTTGLLKPKIQSGPECQPQQ